MVSDKKIENLEKSAVRLTVTLEKDAVRKEYDDVVGQYTKTAQIKGFRKGKVPRDILERKFGDSLKIEALQNLLENAMKTVLEDIDQKPLPYSQPVLEDSPELELDQDFTFSVKYDVYPSITLGEYTGLELEEPEVEITQEDLDRELATLQEQNAMVIEKTEGTVEEKDIVTIDYWEIDEDGNPIESTRREDFVFTVGSGYNIYKLDEDIIGMGWDEEKTVEKTFPDDHELPEYAGTTKKIGVRIKTIKENKLPELDDDLAQDINEKYKTLEDLKKDIQTKLTEAAESRVREIKINSLLDQITGATRMELPDSMIEAELELFWRDFVGQFRMPEERVMQLLQAQGKNRDELYTQWRPNAETRLQKRLVVHKILEQENIEVSDEELDADIASRAEGSNMSVEDMKSYVESNGLREYLRNELAEKKVFDLLLDKSEVRKGAKTKFLDLMQQNG
jgi:trigger factor